MITWFWIPIALMSGIGIGVVATVVFALDREPEKKRWWEE